MAAGMHAACVLRAVGEPVFFLQRQRIQVGAQADGARAVACVRMPAVHHAHHARAGQAGVHLHAPGGQAFGHDGRGAVFLEAQLRVGMQVAPQGHEGRHVGKAFDQVGQDGLRPQPAHACCGESRIL